MLLGYKFNTAWRGGKGQPTRCLRTTSPLTASSFSTKQIGHDGNNMDVSFIDSFAWDDAPDSVLELPSAVKAPSQRVILAVLPFANLSGEANEEVPSLGNSFDVLAAIWPFPQNLPQIEHVPGKIAFLNEDASRARLGMSRTAGCQFVSGGFDYEDRTNEKIHPEFDCDVGRSNQAFKEKSPNE